MPERHEHAEPSPTDEAVEVMAPAPRLPRTIDTPAQRPPPAIPSDPGWRPAHPKAAVVAAVVAQHRSTTELHERFLRTQREFYRRANTMLASCPAVVEDVLDPAAHPWLADHRPNGVVAVVPGTSIADWLARAAARQAGRRVRGLRDVWFRRWLTAEAPVRLRTEVTGPPDTPVVTLSVWHAAKTAGLSRFVLVAAGHVHLGEPPPTRPARFVPLVDAQPRPSPYATGEMFHGPSLRYLVSMRTGSIGCSGVLDCGSGAVPPGLLHHGLLDAAMHGVTSRSLRQWAPGLEHAAFGFPFRLDSLNAFEALPDIGLVDVEVRFAGFDGNDADKPVVDVQLCRGPRVLVDYRMTLILRPLGWFGQVDPGLARAFTEHQVYVADMLLSTKEDGVTLLLQSEVEAVDFLPGTIARIYGLRPEQDTLLHVAAKEHVARLLSVHPHLIEISDDLRTARCQKRPQETFRLQVDRAGGNATVRVIGDAARGPS